MKDRKLGAAALKLTELRKKTGLSIEAFAEKIGMPKTTYANYENRYFSQYIDPEIFEKIAPIMLNNGVSRQEIYGLLPYIGDAPNNTIAEPAFTAVIDKLNISDTERNKAKHLLAEVLASPDAKSIDAIRAIVAHEARKYDAEHPPPPPTKRKKP